MPRQARPIPLAILPEAAQVASPLASRPRCRHPRHRPPAGRCGGCWHGSDRYSRHPSVARASRRPGNCRDGGKFDRDEIAAVDEVAPGAPPSRHLVQVGEVLARIEISGIDITVLTLMTDGADVVGIEYQDISLDCQSPDIADRQVVGNIALGLLPREQVRAELECFLGRSRATGSRRANIDPRCGARNFPPLILLYPRIAEVWVRRFCCAAAPAITPRAKDAAIPSIVRIATLPHDASRARDLRRIVPAFSDMAKP
jgi:hypothetical protein